ncbi:MAG: ATP-binding cassette domain-containing protein [Dehalococcoidia bacterium]|jgi:ABC-2 type transport system ATP-binding protein|nr:ATP-binding cassette domain-containing protein [Dehalococcoidia bacterium]|tara:strand:- start:124 stop:873 length:750 start_codon:yes stop_codon:yes gene_type:complete
MIDVKNLTKKYENIAAVDGISFKVSKGEVFGLLGPNGAGKTTTVEILEGLRKPSSGEATINNFDVSKETKKVKSIIGVQLQSVNFFEELSLSEIVELFADLYSSTVDSNEILDRVGLLKKKDSYFKPLSGGQKQRLSIAVALVNNPKVLFFDEPTTGLDPQARRNMWDLIKSFQKDGKTIVLTTHYMEEAEILCDRVAIIDEGKIIKINSPSNLIDELTKSGFKSTKKVREATLEDVFINLTGKSLRED